jgi:hypothetical protein
MGSILNRKGGLGAALAMLALVLQICVPGGFMVSRDAGAPALVVCTGHGPLTLTDDHGQPGKAPADHGVCAFAGHGAAAVTAPDIAPIPVAYTFSAPASLQTARQSPGRGLAAPPPPSQAPPLRSI